MAFEGSLQELPLPDIIQLVSVSSKTGVFILTDSNQMGKIYLHEGEIVHAEAGTLRGEEAVYDLALWQKGRFIFQLGVETDQRTIKESNTNLLMEAARRIDEWAVLSKRIPSIQLVPVFTNLGSSTSVSFTPLEWAVFCEIDERRSIEDIALILEWSPFVVCKLLFGLITLGLFELREDFDKLARERLEQQSLAEQSELIQRIGERSSTILANHAEASKVEATVGQAKAKVGSEEGVSAILEMASSLERTISVAVGPNQGRLFSNWISRMLQS